MTAQPTSITGLQKAAALLTSIGESASAQIIKHLNEDEVQRVSQAIAQMSNLRSSQAEAVLEEFHQMVLAQQYVVKGGLEYAESMLCKAFGPEHASRLVDHVRVLIANDMSNFD